MTTNEDTFEKQKQKVIGDFQSYLLECQKEVTCILEAVGWTPEHFIQQEDVVSCSFDSSHRMPRKHLEKHEQKCELLFIGYKKEDLDEVLENSNLLSENVPQGHSVHIDKDTMNRVLRDHHVQNHSLFFAQNKLPLTPDEVTVQLTPQERAAIYSYVVKKGKDEKKTADIGNDHDQFLSTDLQEIIKQKELGDKDKPKSYLDYLAAQRDYKRRRQSYRAKNVHITRKSYTEIIREVIENQTEYVASLRREETEESEQKEQTAQSDEDSDVSNRGRSIIRSERHSNRSSHRDNDSDSEKREDSEHRRKDKNKKKKKHKKHKHHKHKHKSYSSSESRSRSRSR